jgi:hypothetical protein
MSADFPHHTSPVPSDERDDQVWALLGEAAPQPAGAMFSRQIMRKIRMEAVDTQPWWRRLMAPLAVSAATAACGIVLGFSLASNQGETALVASIHATTVVKAPANLLANGPSALLEPADDELVMTIADLTGDYSHLEVMMLLGL